MFSDYEISRTTGYIKDDKYIASVYGVSVGRVRRLRAERDKANSGRVRHEQPIGMDSVTKHEAAMEHGSTQLLHSILRERERCIG